MRKIIIVILLLLINVQGKDMKNEIDFEVRNNLMWLIDATDMNHDYSKKFIKEYSGVDEKLQYKSFENYLNYVNGNEKYKYNDWRLPTKEELLALTQEDSFFSKLFIDKQEVKTEICIDTATFYDHKARKIVGYWTSTTCTDDKEGEGYIMVDFNALRFDQHSYAKGSPGSGVIFSCRDKGSKYNLRLVRDIK